MQFENTLTINRPITEVFDYLAHMENVPRWNYAISETTQVSPGPVGVGTQYRQTRTIPRPATEEFQIIAFEPSTLLAIKGQLGPFNGTVRYELTSVSDRETKLVNSVQLQVPKLLGLVAGPLGNNVKQAVAQNLQVLKQLLEA